MSKESEFALQFDPKLMEYCGRSTVVFIWPTENQVPETGGTGVLFRIAPDFHFMLTASHVAKKLIECSNRHRTPFICGAGEVERYPIPFDHVELVSSHLRFKNGDPFDIAAIKLSTSMSEQLSLYSRFLTLNDVDISVEGGSESWFYLLGYTVEGQQAPDFERMVITRDPFHFFTQLETNKANRPLVYDENLHIALTCPLQLQHGPTNEVKNRPDLNGISGCGIWRVGPINRPLTEWKPGAIKLVGLEQRISLSDGYLVGTQIKIVLQLLLDKFPQLAAAMKSVFF